MALVVGAPVLIALFLRVLVALGAPIFETGRRDGVTQRPDDRARRSSA